MKLSIIIPSKNEANGIAYALEGWIRICEGLDYEIIVVDDSNDETPEIVKKFAERYKNIKLVYGERKGVGAARNLGFRHSTGEIIIWSDADGHPNNLREEILKAKRKWLLSTLECFKDEEVDIVFSPGDILVTDNLLANACTIARVDFDVSSVALAYRRSVFKGFPISERITVGEDMDMFLRALRNARKKAISIEPYLVFYPSLLNIREVIASHLWYGREYLPFMKKHMKHGLVNVCGCFAYFVASLLLPFVFLNWIFATPFILGVLVEYARQFKKFSVCRRKKLLHAWFLIPVPAYIQRIAFSLGFIGCLIDSIRRGNHVKEIY